MQQVTRVTSLPNIHPTTPTRPHDHPKEITVTITTDSTPTTPRPTLVAVPLDALLSLVDDAAAIGCSTADPATISALAFAYAQAPTAVDAYIEATDDLDLVDLLTAARHHLEQAVADDHDDTIEPVR